MFLIHKYYYLSCYCVVVYFKYCFLQVRKIKISITFLLKKIVTESMNGTQLAIHLWNIKTYKIIKYYRKKSFLYWKSRSGKNFQILNWNDMLGQILTTRLYRAFYCNIVLLKSYVDHKRWILRLSWVIFTTSFRIHFLKMFKCI